MFKYLIVFLYFVNNVFSQPEISEKKSKLNECCENIKLSETIIDSYALNLNFDCSNLTPFGKYKCSSHKLCYWKKICKLNIKKCSRYSKYELHYGKMVDVGRCSGLCKSNRCGPNTYSELNINDNVVKVIEDCICDNCIVVKSSKLVELPTGRCHGNCNNKQPDEICIGGIKDSFDTTNIELSNPSALLITGILSHCSAGIQSGFDIFIDNRCFGHTFDCIKKGPCKLQSAKLEICMRAANVQLTNTDSLILATGGTPIWGIGLPLLNGGTWNPGEELCTELELGNLPNGGVNIINDIYTAGHIDIAVQDDTAVDYLKLKLIYEKCHKCLQVSSIINVLYTSNGISEHPEISDCDCIEETECSRMDHVHIYYPGTLFEKHINVGQCIGKCMTNICSPVDYTTQLIKSPEGTRVIQIIKDCRC